MATALTGSVAADGQTPITGDLQMSSNRITSLGTPTSAQDAVTKAYVDAGVAALGTMAIQNANNVAITGGAINGATIGASTANTITGTTVTASTQFSGPATGLTGTAASLTAGLSTNSTNAIGYSQTWQNLTSSRASGTTYTNSTGKPIQISIVINATGTGQGTIVINGVTAVSSIIAAASSTPQYTFIIPNSNTYVLTLTSGSINTWLELR
jgi:hypothetical protein